MKLYVFPIIFMMWLKTDLIYCSKCEVQECQKYQGWDDKLYCFSTHTRGITKSLKNITCTWMPNTNASGKVHYKLHMKQLLKTDKFHCKQFATEEPFFVIQARTVYKDVKTMIWVSYTYSTETCIKTQSIHIIPNEICDTPKILRAAHSSNSLILQLDVDGEVRYREITTSHWHIVNTTNMKVEIQLEDSLTERSFIAQQRCSKPGCFQCKWGVETNIPHDLTDAPVIRSITTERILPGKQKVSVKWEFGKPELVDGYTFTVERLPDSCNTVYSRNVSNTELQLNLSMASYKFYISAFNKAGYSPSVSSIIVPLFKQDFPGTIHATVQNNSIFLTWSPKINCSFFIINWGTNLTQMESKAVMNKMDYYSLAGPFEEMKQYTIMIHTYERCKCEDEVTMETTFGLKYIYAEEGVPRLGPSHITIQNITKHSAFIQWQEIPEEDCMGVLLGYRIYYTDLSANTTQDVFVNSTSTSYQLMGLTKGNTYKIQISGTTSKGVGIPSILYDFTTLYYAGTEFHYIVISTCIGIILLGILLFWFCAYTLHRTKVRYFPKIPNPKHSNIVKMNGESTAKSELLPSLLVSQEQCNTFTSHLEVTDKVLIVPNTLEASMHEDDDICTQKSQKRNQNIKHKAPSSQVANEYTSITLMVQVAKKMTQSTNDDENIINVNASQPARTAMQAVQGMSAFQDYVRESRRMDMPSHH